MEHRAIPEQVLLEHEVLANLTDAIRATIGWKYPGEDWSRRLSSLTFVMHSFQRHCEHLMTLEEHEGYMDVIERGHPEFCSQIAGFRQEHTTFREAIAQLLQAIDQMSPTDHVAISNACEQTRALLHQVEDHSNRETRLIQEALVCGSRT